ncbi:MAG: S9 family peptidase [Acidimicrobiia bacterium]|nr:S9 family peptidase [Acidimicrobiia bacterium]
MLTTLGVQRPPEAPRRPTELTAHGDTRVDDWYWLRHRDDPEVIAYLEAENAWTEQATGHTAALEDKLFEEIKGRIQETDVSAPVRYDSWWYYTRSYEGSQYGVHCRRRARAGQRAADALADTSDEEVVVDENLLAEGHEYFALGALQLSPDHALAAYSIDTEGDEVYTLRVRDMTTGADLADEIPGTYYGVDWSEDNRTLFYTVLDEAKRPFQVYRHRVGTVAADDVLVYQEDDEAFHVGLGKTRSRQWLVIASNSAVTSEARVIPAADPEAEPRLIAARRQDVEYDVDHHGDRFFIVTNDGAENFKLVEAPVDDPRPARWRDVVPHRDDVRLLGADAFASHLALYERAEGLTRLRVLRLSDGELYGIDHPEPVHTVGPGFNPEFDTTTLRFHYTSLVTPDQSIDYDMATRTRTVVKQQPVLGGYDPSRYATERTWATAADGTRIPISLAWRTDREPAGPALLYGYGSYEYSVDPRFSSVRLSLLDRGFVYAIAHVRGGGELGRRGYEGGKLFRKRNTFTDFVAAAAHLVDAGLTTPAGLVARGGSAGGLLMGAVANMRPDLFAAIVAEVPFVDALTTILDESLPLTVIEWEEWGNPVTSAEVYAYMKSYAPYDNVEAKDYPALLVRGGLNDPRVGFWEPAKWVAKLRALKTDDRPLILKTDMGAGHGGPSGRYDAWKDEAFVLAFVIDTAGVGG